jgi:hypothetical protein
MERRGVRPAARHVFVRRVCFPVGLGRGEYSAGKSVAPGRVVRQQQWSRQCRVNGVIAAYGSQSERARAGS